MPKIIAIDTEFERKRTYRPILSIVQIKVEKEEVKIYDVFKVDNEKLVDLIELLSNDDNIKIIHSARQDIEAIYYRFHIAIKNVFDTQIAEKCLYGKNEIGYAELVKKYCNVNIVKEKKLQNSNWLKRPLTEQQIVYAKQDVEYLYDVYIKMNSIFQDKKEYYDKFKSECAILENEDTYCFNPQHFWQKIKHKFGYIKNYKLCYDLFILREKLAFSLNLPREFVIKTHDLFNFSETGNIEFLKTHHRVDKNKFISVFKENI